jgi:hypothetical protein
MLHRWPVAVILLISKGCGNVAAGFGEQSGKEIALGKCWIESVPAKAPMCRAGGTERFEVLFFGE